MKTRIQNVIRNDSLSCLGFGREAMERVKVCGFCSSLEPSRNAVCSDCGERLPKKTLYDLYREQHEICDKCGTVLSEKMRYCPRCGKKQLKI